MSASGKQGGEPGQLNPLISNTSADTIYSAQCAVEYLARVQADLADSCGLDSGPDGQLKNEIRGLSHLLACIAAALDFEVKRA